MTSFLKDWERTAVFIDGPATYTAAKNIDMPIDWSKLYRLLTEKADLVRMYYYTTVRENDPLNILLDYLEFNGYHVVRKPLKEWEVRGVRYQKVDTSNDLIIDVLAIAKKVAHVILFTGNEDLVRLVSVVQDRGVRVSVISTKTAASDSLRRQADSFIELESLRDQILRVF